MKKVLILWLIASTLGGCDHIPAKFDESVRAVEVTGSTVDEWSEEPELHVSIRDIETKETWDVNLGTECRRYPLKIGEKFLVRVNLLAAPIDRKKVFVEPQASAVWKYLCE